MSTVVRIGALALRDTTYVRNSGNFRRAVIGEGGPVLGSRAFHFDATVGFDSTPSLPIVDKGISRPLDVTDFISTTFGGEGVGINFDGELAELKGESTYARSHLPSRASCSRGGRRRHGFTPLNTGLTAHSGHPARGFA